MSDFQRDIDAFADDLQRVRDQVQRVIVAQDEPLDQVLTCLLAGGHGLLEGVPGLGKTLLVRTLAKCLSLSFSRIQFTPDLMPADVTGTQVISEDLHGGRSFEFRPGPIFANLVLADEINRATPKTQSALLEAMQEATVSVARLSHELPQPQAILATQNPIELEGTYPLPEAQLDRFMLKIVLERPSETQLDEILARTTGPDRPDVSPVLDGQRVLAMKQVVRQVVAARDVTAFAATLCEATHPDADTATPLVKQYVRYGASPRAAQAMVLGGKVAALRAGRANVSIADLTALAGPAMRHRLVLNFEAHAEGIDPDAIIREVLQSRSA